jgi:hypothetical protein
MRTQNITRPSTGYDCATDTPQSREFFAMQLCQLEELYTQYGNFSEVWFDGGKYHCNSFRPDLSTDDPDVPGVGTCLPSYEKAIANLTQFYQVLSVWLVSLEYPAITPLSFQGDRAVAFQGPSTYVNSIRWVGTEHGVAQADTWSSAASSQDYGPGQRDGKLWAPAEADTCIRTATCCAPGGPAPDTGGPRAQPNSDSQCSCAGTCLLRVPGCQFLPVHNSRLRCLAACCAVAGSAGCWAWYPNTTDSVKSAARLQDSYLKTVRRTPYAQHPPA